VDNSTVQVVHRFKSENYDPSDSDELAQEDAESSSNRSGPISVGCQSLDGVVREEEIIEEEKSDCEVVPAYPIVRKVASVEWGPPAAEETFYNSKTAKRR
jgi:hypothetical protein